MDWSSDVCSSDLEDRHGDPGVARGGGRLMLWCVHGWGFETRVWDSLRAALGDPAACLPDFGYFGDAASPADGGGPVIAIGHSLGVMKLLRKPPTNCIDRKRVV